MTWPSAMVRDNTSDPGQNLVIPQPFPDDKIGDPTAQPLLQTLRDYPRRSCVDW